jgi:Holliday junction DNA helicase RuvA
MIAFVKGELDSIDENRIVVENGGVGFEIMIPLSAAEKLPSIGSSVKIYTYTYVREDILQLYGFLTRDELAMFKMVITVNGIGPKGALSIFSVLDADSLRFAILSDDAKSIAKAQGIGIKIASKLILELKDKCSLEDVLSMQTDNRPISADSGNGMTADAIQALVALGYTSGEAVSAIKSVEITPDMSVEDILKAGLKAL